MSYFFEFQTKFQCLYSFNLLDIYHFKFDDEKKTLLLNFGEYDHYYFDEDSYKQIKETLLLLTKTLPHIIYKDLYIFINHVGALAMNSEGYFFKYKSTSPFYSISKEYYYFLLELIRKREV